ncbi:MAG TPA: hypothetical protein P5230_01825 [Candidatus Magasanikbacteria bacterium]|nr:hypothetical protein [Candidatus Magasanikbacteria bacterium]
MKRVILITFSDPKDTWRNFRWEKFIRYFLGKVKERFGINEDVDFIVKYISSDESNSQATVVGKFFLDKKELAEVAGVVIEVHNSLKATRNIRFLVEILREDLPIELFFFENKTLQIVKDIVGEKLIGEDL